MSILPSNIFIEIRNQYKRIIHPEIAPDQKRKAANIIVNKIVDFVYAQDDRKNLKTSIDFERQRRIKNGEVKRPSYDDRPYTSKYGELHFLCDQEYIPKRFKPSMLFLLQRGDKETISETKTLNLKGKESEYSIHEIINQILSWFLDANEQSKDYLVSLDFLNVNESTYKQAKSQEIRTLFNIKSNEKNWFKKYQTFLTYLFIFSPLIYYLWSEFVWYLYFEYKIDLPEIDLSFLESSLITPLLNIILLWLVFFVISLIGLYNTYYYAIKKSVRYIRYFIFSLVPIGSVVGIVIGVFILSTSEDNQIIQMAELDSDPNLNGEGFLYISPFKSIHELDSLAYFDFVDFKELPIDSLGHRQFYLEAHVRNIGNKKIDSAYVRINRSQVESDVRLEVTLSEKIYNRYMGSRITNVVKITNIDPKKYYVSFHHLGRVFYCKFQKENEEDELLASTLDSIGYMPYSANKAIFGHYGTVYNILPSYIENNAIHKVIYCFQGTILPISEPIEVFSTERIE